MKQILQACTAIFLDAARRRDSACTMRGCPAASAKIVTLCHPDRYLPPVPCGFMPHSALAVSLGGRIRSGAIAAGQMLRVQSITRAYGVGTATVLQALRALQRDGVVTPCATQGGAWRVNVPDADGAAELLDILEHLELFCLARQGWPGSRSNGYVQSSLVWLHARLWQMCGESCRRRVCAVVDGIAREQTCAGESAGGADLEMQWSRLCGQRRRIVSHAVARRCRNAHGEAERGMEPV